MFTIREIISIIEDFAPLALQEGFDNCGVQVGDVNNEAKGVLLTLDVTIEVIEEALAKDCNLIIAHHPITLTGIKSLTGSSLSEKLFIKAIQENITIYAAHTNIDSVRNGVSAILANKIGLINQQILAPVSNQLIKLVTFVPHQQADEVRQAIFKAGAGHIGKYDNCSYNIEGEGTFRGEVSTTPFAGKAGELHTEPEIRIETVAPSFLKSRIIKALIATHPYEEPAYDIYPLKNEWAEVGLGIIGELQEDMSASAFLAHLKETTSAECIRHTQQIGETIKRVAVCGGSGSSLLEKALAAKADVFVTGDFKYHQFFDGINKIMIADIGHYESEQFIKGLFLEILTKKIPNFAFHLSEVNSNPIKYF